MELKERIKQYFNLSDEDKDELLVTIVDEYKSIISKTGDSLEYVIDLDIEFFIENDEYEAVQALTDIKRVIEQINKEH